MTDPGGDPYQPYRPPASPAPDHAPVPAYDVYDAPAGAAEAPAPPPPPSAATARPGGSRTLLAGVAVALISVLGAGLLFRATSGPVEVETPGGTISVHADSIRKHLEATRDRYMEARKDGDLESVGLADTPLNDIAVLAFGYLLTDMVIAAGFGIDDDTAVEYAQDAAEYERLLLTGKPLGSDIEIQFSDDRAFTYDGETGEGGYVDPSPAG